MNSHPLCLFAATTVAATAGYVAKIRPWMKRWGATEDETRMTLPGDDLLSNPAFETTRAITIEATPAEIWPWLVQIGQGRGGFYSYDWLENLFRLDIHTVDRVVPDLQQLRVDDFISFAPQEGAGMMVVSLEPERAMVLLAPDPHYADVIQGQIDEPDFEMEGTWAFVLEPVDERSTRLIVRLRMSHTPSPGATALMAVLLEPAHFIMERKMLLGIKERVERQRKLDIPRPPLLAEVA